MRALALMPLLVVAACGSGDAPKNEAAPAAARIAAGQWELASEVTAFRTVDNGAAAINTPVGTRATESICVSGERAPAEFFSGPGFDCTDSGAYYVRNGRINVTLSCSRDGLSGQIPIGVDGTFAAETAAFERSIRTVLVGEGDVELTARITARRTGDCTAAGAGDNAAAPR